MIKKDSFTCLTRDIVDELAELEQRHLKPSKKLRILTDITKRAINRLNKLEQRRMTPPVGSGLTGYQGDTLIIDDPSLDTKT